MIRRDRKAFSILTALFIIILMSSVGALVSGMSGKIIKQTTSQYQRVQAVLLAKSYTEFAIMAVTAKSRGTDCVDTIQGNFGQAAGNPGYNVNINIQYIGSSAEVNTCTNNLVTADDTLNILIDVYITYQDFDHPLWPAAPNITYHRRTLQKI